MLSVNANLRSAVLSVNANLRAEICRFGLVGRVGVLALLLPSEE